MSSVYLMKNMDNGYYKLGFSDRPEYRERTLQAQEPDVRLLATVSGTKELEQKLELGFAKHRVRGEWFSFSGLALSSIAEVFGVSVEMIDPPSETFDVQYCVAHIHRYAGPQYSTRLLEKCTKEVILEVPYVLSPSEAQVELDAEGRAWNIELQWQSDHLRTAFRVIQLSEYRLADDLHVTLLELRCLATADTRGYYVDAHTRGGRFYPDYPDRRYAETYFNRMKRCFDVYNKMEA
jgi:hypothetical protein